MPPKKAPGLHQQLLGRVCHAANIYNWPHDATANKAFLGKIVAVRASEGTLVLTLETGKGRLIEVIGPEKVTMCEEGAFPYPDREDSLMGAAQRYIPGEPHSTSNRRYLVLAPAAQGEVPGRLELRVGEPPARPFGEKRRPLADDQKPCCSTGRIYHEQTGNPFSEHPGICANDAVH